MTTKMGIELENKFMKHLIKIQTKKKAYWVQAKHIAVALFGNSLSKKEFQKNKMRIYRLGKRLEEQDKLETTSKRMQVGKSTGQSLIIFYHTDRKLGGR